MKKYLPLLLLFFAPLSYAGYCNGTIKGGVSMDQADVAQCVKQPGVYTFATLPPVSSVNVGTTAYTSDQGVFVATTSGWSAVAGTSSVTPSSTTTFTNKSISGSTNTLTNLPAAALTGTVPAAALPNPSATTLGGTESITVVTHQFLTGISTSGVPTQAQPAFTDISGSVASGQLPNPSASTLGGVESLAVVTHNFLTGISTSGVPTQAQPAFTDISGTASAAQIPNPSASTIGGVESITVVTHNFLTGISTSGVPTQAQPAFTDISGTATAAQIPNPTASTIGGTESITCGSHTWISVISTSGVPSCTQPAFTDISGSVAASQMPALTGNCVTTAGAVAVTCPIQQNAQSASYQLVIGDAQFEIYHNSSSAHTFTIPANASVAFPIGTCVMFTNETGGGVITIAITTDTLNFYGDTGSRSLAANGSAVACKKLSTTWFINGYGIT